MISYRWARWLNGWIDHRCFVFKYIFSLELVLLRFAEWILQLSTHVFDHCPTSQALIWANTMDPLPALILLFFREGTVSSANAFWMSAFYPLLYPAFSLCSLMVLRTHTHTLTQACGCGSTFELNITVKYVFPLGYCLSIVRWLCVPGLFVSAWLESACLLWLNGSRGGWGTEPWLFLECVLQGKVAVHSAVP